MELKFNLNGKEDNSVEVEQVEAEKKTIYEIRNYEDGEGRSLIGHYPTEDPENPVFMGTFVVPTNLGNMRFSMEFEEGMTIEECYEHFDEEVKKVIEEAQKKANEQNRIVPASQMPQGPIITP